MTAGKRFREELRNNKPLKIVGANRWRRENNRDRIIRGVKFYS